MSSEGRRYSGDVAESKVAGSALAVNAGVEQPPMVNPNIVGMRKRKPQLSCDDFVAGILAGDVNILSQAITLIESRLHAHYALSQEIITRCLPHSGNSVRIGITGVPGVGKSTFIEAFGLHLASLGRKLAVLAIDPSSGRSGGSILGDKTRMAELSTCANVFIRPSPSSGSLGGVARKTRETIVLCEAAGYDTIIIETVGVGQSEVAVHSMVDFFLLLMLAGAGDELQGIKRGIMEMADAIIITKADGSNVQKAKLAKAQYESALRLFPQTESLWQPKTNICSAVEKTGIGEIWSMILQYITQTTGSGYFAKNRKLQSRYWLYESINEAIKERFYSSPAMQEALAKAETDIENNVVSSFNAATTLLNIYFDEE